VFPWIVIPALTALAAPGVMTSATDLAYVFIDS
jgi:hypothetical protein